MFVVLSGWHSRGLVSVVFRPIRANNEDYAIRELFCSTGFGSDRDPCWGGVSEVELGDSLEAADSKRISVLTVSDYCTPQGC